MSAPLSASTITRMVDMGVDPFMVASATLLVSAQRLMRRLCPRCRGELDVKPEKLRTMGYTEDEIREGVQLYRAVGCNRCTGGYAGRFALLETLPVTEAIKRMVIDGHSAIEIRNKALEEGMISLRRCALLNAIRGNTSIEEVLRVTLGENAVLRPFVTLRADGHRNDIGDHCRFLDRATVHVADGLLSRRALAIDFHP